MRFFPSFVISICLVASLPAQTFTILGEVEQSSTGWILADVDIPLRTSTSLSSFRGKIAEIRGTNVGTTAKPIINVTSIREADDKFESGGDPRIGGTLRLKLISKRGLIYYIFVHVRRGFIPTDNLFPNLKLRGTFFLDINGFYLFGPGRFSGNWDERIPVPNAPSLIGLRVWGQGATVFSDGSALYLNAVSVVLRSR